MTDRLRKEFELAMLFPNNVDPPCGKANCLIHDGSQYRDRYMEGAFQGFKLGVKSTESQLSRFDEGRNIGPGFMTKLKEELGNDNTVTPAVIRAVLKTAAFFP